MFDVLQRLSAMPLDKKPEVLDYWLPDRNKAQRGLFDWSFQHALTVQTMDTTQFLEKKKDLIL